MTRSIWLTRAVGMASLMAFLAGLSGAIAAERRLDYPQPTCKSCVPNVRNWGYNITKWRVWPGDEKLPERTNAPGLGKEVLPTPVGQQAMPLPATTVPPRRAPQQSEPVPEPPPEGILPPEGLLFPPGSPDTPGQGAPLTPAPQTPGGQGLPGLPELPPEPQPTQPPTQPEQPKQPPAQPKPENQPATPSDTPAPKEKAQSSSGATIQVGVQQNTPWSGTATFRTTVLPENQLRAPMASPAVGTESAEVLVPPMSRLEPERNAAPSGAYRADPIVTGPSESRTDRVEPVAYAEPPEPPATLAAVAPARESRAAVAKPAAEAALPSVALGGYCAVELSRNGRWAHGDVRWTVVYDGRIYRLSGPQQREEFLANPEAFVPAAAGNDPVLLKDSHCTVAGQTAFCATYGGRLYMFSCQASQERFNSNPNRYATGK
ncbi:MAG: hypothetical protein ABFC63_07030 [Thermoguttaceae bacterium]